MTIISRRKLITGAAIGAGSLLSGCDALNRSAAFQDVLASAETANFTVQRALGDRMELASEYRIADLSPKFRANGTRDHRSGLPKRAGKQHHHHMKQKE